MFMGHPVGAGQGGGVGRGSRLWGGQIRRQGHESGVWEPPPGHLPVLLEQLGAQPVAEGTSGDRTSQRTPKAPEQVGRAGSGWVVVIWHLF